MSAIETFYLLFKSDTGDSQKKITELNSSLKKTEQISNSIDSKAKGLLSNIARAAVAAVSVGAIVVAIKSAAQYAEHIRKTSVALRVGEKDLDAWGAAVTRNGGSAQGLESSISAINTRLAQVGRYGASATNELLKLSSRFERMSNMRSMSLGKSMGLDEGTIMLLQKGRKTVEELLAKQKEYSVLTHKDTEIVKKFNEQFFDLKRAFTAAFVGANATILPALTYIARGFEKVFNFLLKHKPLIEGVMIAIGAAIAVFLIPPLVTAAVSMTLLNAPLYALIAIVATVGAVFALAYDDIKTFIAGGDSLYGRIVTKFPIIHKVIKGIGDSVKHMKDVFLWSIETVNSSIMKIINTLLKAKDALKSWLGLSKDTAVNSTIDIKKAQDTLKLVGSSPLSSQSSASISNVTRSSNRSTSVTTGDITIQTQATNSDEIAKHFNRSLKEQISQATNNYSDGVVA